MTQEFDIIIVGSGPAGISAAFPLVESGLKVLMVDGGRDANIMLPEKSFLSARAEDSKQWEWMIGKNFHALQMQKALSPKLRVPTHKYVLSDFCRVCCTGLALYELCVAELSHFFLFCHLMNLRLVFKIFAGYHI